MPTKKKTPEQRADNIVKSLVQGLGPDDRKHVHEGMRVLLKRIATDEIKHAVADATAE
ncbi:hypothetical protein K2Z84_05140 [Candidatus Binatia bacterium]|nr:hypothetical protein [Candidatus Binatia bacterium]